MDKNLIKINGTYNKINQGEEFNIFCTMIIDLKNYKINIKNCEVDIKNDLKFDDWTYNILEKSENKVVEDINLTLKKSLETIKIILEKTSYYEGDEDFYLQNLANFIFQYIYNEIYIQGTMSFQEIKLINEY